jgi:pyruvate/2-oxoglutarate dehydrogenase complex dihydrolipoamide dehydrogenase (E3) component
MARICIQNALFHGAVKFSSIVLPWCTFSQPEVAHVGAYARDLQARGVKFATFRKEFSDNDRSRCEGSEAEVGFVKVTLLLFCFSLKIQICMRSLILAASGRVLLGLLFFS